jgi:hypothetical protein
MTACNLDRSFARIVGFCFENSSEAAGMAGDVACAAGGEYARQAIVTVDDLIVSDPAKWVARIDFFSTDKRSSFFDIFSMASCTFLTGTIGETSRTQIYALSSVLFGICKYRTPDSSEFSIASFCRRLSKVKAERLLSSTMMKKFGQELFVFVDSSSGYWNKPWVKLACASLSIAHSDPVVRSGVVWDYVASNIDFSEIEKSIDRFRVSCHESESLQDMI